MMAALENQSPKQLIVHDSFEERKEEVSELIRKWYMLFYILFQK